MPQVIQVAFPVLHRYRPPRMRRDRYGIGAGTVPATLREVGEAPREVLRTKDHRILAAEGAAWSPLSRGGQPVTAGMLAEFLSTPGQMRGPGERVIDAWARRSPLLFVNGDQSGRVGTLGIPPGSQFADGRDRCARDVLDFLDDRVRIHGGNVLVREESLVGLYYLAKARPDIHFDRNPRYKGLHYWGTRESYAAIRPDRLAALWACHGRKMRGAPPEGAWDPLATIPPELLRDDDVTWMANRLPERLFGDMRSSWYDLAERSPDAKERDLALRARLEGHARLGMTHSVTGHRVEAALRDCREALESIVALRRTVRVDSDGDLKVYEAFRRYLDGEYMPRLAGEVSPQDEADLAGLAPA